MTNDFELPVQLGNYTLREFVGAGGMSRVYRAEGVGGEQFAVKLVTHSSASRAHFRLAILREIRALAQLYHPNIVRVLDAGYVRGEDVEGSGGILPQGAPYMVSEFLDGFELERVLGRTQWSALRPTMLAVLDALGHAHGLGIVHRDLKPSNVMVVRENEAAAVKLADFGVSRSLYRDVGSSARVSGTPLYMAPEQAMGQWRDEGPWTDIYALGVMTWKGVCGKVPFDGTTGELLRAHALDDLPEFEPTITVPRRIENWLHKALAKAPGDRFQTAAEASLALLELETPREGRGRPTDRLPAVRVAAARPDLADTILDAPVPAITFDGVQSATSTGSDWPRPTLPTDWRRRRWGAFEPVRLGTGLGIVSSRSVPLVGRDAVRDRLWEVLREVHESGEVRGIFVEAEAGLGKTKLVEWLQCRSREVGVCEPFTVRGLRWKSATESLRQALERHFLTMGCDRTRTFGRIVQAFERRDYEGRVATFDAAAIAELLTPDDDNPEVSAERSIELWSPVARYVTAISTSKTVVCVIEDVHLAGGLTDLVAAIVERVEGPVMIVVTARPTEELDERRSQLLDELAFEHLSMGPLAPAEQLQLVEGTIGLEAELARYVATASKGVPEVALEMIRYWVEQDVLEPTSNGLCLRADAIIDDLPGLSDEAFWESRITAAAGDLPLETDDVLQMLEIAAVLGAEVSTEDWQKVSRASEEDVSALVDELSRHGFIHAAATGWELEREELRDFLLESAEAGGRLESHHQRCLAFVETSVAESDGRSFRRGRHLDGLGRAVDAFGAYEQALEIGLAMIDREVVRRCSDAMTRLAAQLPSRDDFGVRLRLAKAREASANDDFEQARTLARGVIEDADLRGWKSLAVRGEVVRADALREAGKTEAAGDGYERVLERAARVDDRRSLAQAHNGLANVCGRAGRTDEVKQHATAALELARELGDPRGECEGLFWYSVGWQLEARLDEAEEELRQATEIARANGYRLQLAWCLNSQAELARLRDQPAASKKLLEEAAALHRSLGRDRDALVPELNVALLDIGSEDFERAHARLLELEGEAESSGDVILSFYLPMRVITAARIPPHDGLDECIRRTAAVTSRTGTYLPEFAQQLERAGRALLESGAMKNAGSTLQLTETYYYAVGDADGLERVRAMLETVHQ